MENAEGPGKFYARKCDVSKEDEVVKAFDYVKQTFKSLSVLVNNAGTILINSIEGKYKQQLRHWKSCKCVCVLTAAETSELDKIISLNLMGPVYCSKQAIKLMKENNNEAYIINMNRYCLGIFELFFFNLNWSLYPIFFSYAGHKVPHRSWFKNQEVHTNVYSPSKFGLTALSEVLINELLGNKIRVTVIFTSLWMCVSFFSPQ